MVDLFHAPGPLFKSSSLGLYQPAMPLGTGLGKINFAAYFIHGFVIIFSGFLQGFGFYFNYLFTIVTGEQCY